MEKKLYIMVGQNPNEQYFWKASCGDIKTKEQWLDCLFGERKNYFDGFTWKEIREYILKYCGMRLEVYDKKWN